MKRIPVIILVLLVWNNVFAFYYRVQPLPKPRQMQGAAVLGDYVYVIGGNVMDMGWVSSVVKARIYPNGSIGQWSSTTSMPQSRAYIGNTTIVLNDVLYVVGGFNGKDYYKTIVWARGNPDGSLQEWQESIPLPGPGVDCAAAVATPGHIYLIGGGTGSPATPVRNVLVAELDQNGGVVGWRHGPSLPEPLWLHNVAVVGGRLWVWAGLTTKDNTSVNPYIYFAPLRADGSIGSWDRGTVTMPRPVYGATGCACGKYLISFCGRYSGGGEHSDIWFTKLTNNTPGKWQQLGTRIPLRVYNTVATDFRRGFLYLPGGRFSREDKSSLRSDVYYLKLAADAAQETKTSDEQVAKTETIQEDETQRRMTYAHQSNLPSGTLPGFVAYEQARSLSRQKRLPLVLYFHSPKANACRRQIGQLKNFNFQQYQGKIIFAWVDTTLFPQLVQQMGIFRVPTWVFFDRAGNNRGSKIGVISTDELAPRISGL